MDSDSSESVDDDCNPQNARFDEQQIAELLTCLQKVINILLHSLKKDTKRIKERKLIKKGSKNEKKPKVSHAHGEIRKLCSTIKDLRYSRRRNVAESSASKSLTEAITGTSPRHTETIAGTSRSHTEALSRTSTSCTLVTSRSHTEPKAGTSKSHTEVTAGTSRSHRDAIVETTRSHTEVITATCRSHIEAMAATSRSRAEAIVETSGSQKATSAETFRCHTESTVGTSRSHAVPKVTKEMISETTAVHSKPISHTDAVAATHRCHAKAVTGNSSYTVPPVTVRNHTEAISLTSTNQIEEISGTSRKQTQVVPENSISLKVASMTETSQSHTNRVPGTSRHHKETPATETKNQTKRVPGASINLTKTAVTKTSEHQTKRVPGASINLTKTAVTKTSEHQTKRVPGASINLTKTAVTETSERQTKRVPGASINLTKTAVTETSEHQTKGVPGASINLTKTAVTETSERQTKRVPGTSINHTEKSVTKTSKHQTKVVPGTSAHLTETAVAEKPKNQTNDVPGASMSRTEKAVIETSEHGTKRSPETSINHADKAMVETSKYHTNGVSGTTISNTETAMVETSNDQTSGVSETTISNTETAVFETSKNQAIGVSGTTISKAETALVETSNNQRSRVSGTTISNIETVLAETSDNQTNRSRTEAVSQTPRSQTETVGARISFSPTASIVAETKKIHTQSTLEILGSHTEPVIIPRTDTEAVPETSRGNSEATPGNPKKHSEARVTTVSHTKHVAYVTSVTRIETVDPATSSRHTEQRAETAKCHTKRRRNSSISIKKALPGTSTNNTDAVKASKSAETSKRPSEGKISNNSNNHLYVAEKRSDRHTAYVHENILGDDLQQTEMTSLQTCNEKNKNASNNVGIESHNNISTAKRNTETPKKSRLDNNDLFGEINIYRKMKHNKENYEHKNEEVTRSESSHNGHTEQAITNSILAKVTDINGGKNKAVAKKRTATKSESSPNRHTENANLISTLSKISNTDKNNKSTNGRKSKSATENLAPNVRTEEKISSTSAKIAETEKNKKNDVGKKRKIGVENEVKLPVTTPKKLIKKPITNSTLGKTASDNDNKSVGGKENNKTEKNSAPDRDSERAITCGTLTDAGTDREKKTASAMNSSETKSDSNLKPNKIADTEQAKKPADGKKMKASGVDFGAFKNTTSYTTIDLTSDNDDDEMGSLELVQDNKKNNDQQIIDICEGTRTYNPTVESKSKKVVNDPCLPAANDQVTKKQHSIINIDEGTCSDEQDEEKTSVPIEKTWPKSTDDDQILKNQQVIDVSEDTSLYDAVVNVNVTIKKSRPKSKNNEQILQNQPVIDISEDTCSYNLTEEEITVLIKEPRPRPEDGEQILKDQHVIDISDDTSLYDASEQIMSVTIKGSSPKTLNSDEILSDNHAISDNISKAAEASVTNLESKKMIKINRTKITEELERKNAEELLMSNVKKEQTGKNVLDNTEVSSVFFHAPSYQKSNEGCKTAEQNITQKKQSPQSKPLKNCNDKHRTTSNNVDEKPEKSMNKLNPSKLIPEITVTTKEPDASVSRSSPTVVQQSAQKANQLNTDDKLTSNDPGIVQELSISIRSTPITDENPNLSITQSGPQTARPNGITTGTAASEHGTSIMESRPGKPKPVETSKRHRSDSGQSPKRDTSKKRREQITNPVDNNAEVHEDEAHHNTVSPDSSEWRSVPLQTLISNTQHSASAKTGNLSTNLVCSACTPEPVSTLIKDLKSKRREPTTNDQQYPQTKWYKPFPLENPPLKKGTRNPLSVLSEAHSRRYASTINDGSPKHSWHKPVLIENERPEVEAQTAIALPDSSTHQSNIPSQQLIPDTHEIPIVPSTNPVAQPNLPLLLTPRNQSTMMSPLKSPVATQRTWHIPTDI